MPDYHHISGGTEASIMAEEMLENDLPQMEEAKAARSPERDFMLALLKDGIQGSLLVCPQERSSPGRRRARHVREDRAWVLSERRDYCTSFEMLCEALGFDPGRVRRALVAKWEVVDKSVYLVRR